MTTNRGIGLTELMIANLPYAQCTIIVPSREIGNEIDKRIAETRQPGTWRTIVVTNHADVQKMAGLSEPVFFDHSFFDCGPKNPRAIKEAVETAIVSSRMAKWKTEAAEPNTDAKTAKEQPLVAANDDPIARVKRLLVTHGNSAGALSMLIGSGVVTPNEARVAAGLPPLAA